MTRAGLLCGTGRRPALQLLTVFGQACEMYGDGMSSLAVGGSPPTAFRRGDMVAGFSVSMQWAPTSFATFASFACCASTETPRGNSNDTDDQRAANATDDVRYHQEADHALDVMYEEFERMIDEAGMEDADIELSQGVLTLNLASLGTYVINKQAPNRQLWVSSPVSGPMRYDLVGGFWVNTRRQDDPFLHEVLQNEMRMHVGVDIDISPCSHCERENACLNNYACVSGGGQREEEPAPRTK